MVWQSVWLAAAETFGKEAGFKDSLTPYSRTWKTILVRFEHAFWVWNDKYGPLNADQRAYAVALVEHSFEHAKKAPTVSDRYAYFNHELTKLVNHEKVDRGFESRADRHKDIPSTLPEGGFEVA